MPLINPISIAYGGVTVGGDTAYQLDGPFVIERSFDAVRLVFAVVVAAEDFNELGTLCAALESASRGRLTGSIVITVGGTASTYTVGSSILKARAGIAKSGNPDTDKAHSRGYTVTIAGEAPADTASDGGLRELEVLVNYLPSRQKTVTMRGVYTATSSGDARERYTTAFDAIASSYLSIAGSGDTFELVDESYTLDRETGTDAHLCSFSRQYVQLIAKQSTSLDDAQIRDHRVTFTDLGQYPGDGREDAERMRRVVASFDCAVDVDETTDLRGVFSNKIKRYLREQFRSNFEPIEFAVEDERVSFDTTANRLSVSTQYIYQNTGAEKLVEVSQSVAYRENRTIDYTPVHDGGEFSAVADVGFASLERIFNRTAIVIGEESPKLRLRETARGSQALGAWTDPVAGVAGPDSRNTSAINRDGWNTISNTSQASPQWIGNPGEENRIRVTVLTETVVERFNTRPGTRTSVPIQTGPITG